MPAATIPVIINLGHVSNATLRGSIEILLNHTIWKILTSHANSHGNSSIRLVDTSNLSDSTQVVSETKGEFPPYDQSGAGLYACLVIAFYAFSIIMFIATIVKRKVCNIRMKDKITY